MIFKPYKHQHHFHHHHHQHQHQHSSHLMGYKRNKQTRSRYQIVLIATISYITQLVIAQSIGYQPNFNYGFNPYLSPVHGYGLGLPYGSYSYQGLKHPWLGHQSLWGSASMFGGLASKLHTKSILKKLGSNPYPGYYPYSGLFGGKYSSALSSTPYIYDYGYGSHYGAAQIPNNPYKSTYYPDYYSSGNGQKLTTSLAEGHSYYDTNTAAASIPEYTIDKHAIIKPLIKAGALITTAAILGKKKFELVPSRLNPAGMILNGVESKITIT